MQQLLFIDNINGGFVEASNAPYVVETNMLKDFTQKFKVRSV